MFKYCQPFSHPGDTCRAGPSDFTSKVTFPERKELYRCLSVGGQMVRSEGGMPFQVWRRPCRDLLRTQEKDLDCTQQVGAFASFCVLRSTLPKTIPTESWAPPAARHRLGGSRVWLVQAYFRVGPAILSPQSSPWEQPEPRLGPLLELDTVLSKSCLGLPTPSHCSSWLECECHHWHSIVILLAWSKVKPHVILLNRISNIKRINFRQTGLLSLKPA